MTLNGFRFILSLSCFIFKKTLFLCQLFNVHFPMIISATSKGEKSQKNSSSFAVDSNFVFSFHMKLQWLKHKLSHNISLIVFHHFWFFAFIFRRSGFFNAKHYTLSIFSIQENHIFVFFLFFKFSSTYSVSVLMVLGKGTWITHTKYFK